MANRPLRATGFTRFFLIMLLIAPLAYLGASYYNGEDGIQNLKNLLRIGSKTEASSAKEGTSPDATATTSDCEKLKSDLEYATRRIEELKQENEDIRRKLMEVEKSK